MDRVRCSACGVEHDLSEIEPSFDRPDAYFDVPSDERAKRAWNVEDLCVIWETESSPRRHFVRVLLPFQVRGDRIRYNWGTWVEVADADFAFIHDHWSDPAQASAAPMHGHVANEFPDMASTVGLAGELRMTGPGTIPEFYLNASTGHSLAIEQRDGVLPERVIEWASLVAHP